MSKHRRELSPGWAVFLVAASFFCCVNCQIETSVAVENKTGNVEDRARVFSPRMDYDEWTPLGRGDPLKNDPTFDYVPPVLDRVQYWLDSHTTEPSAKRDILVLGVTAKKTSSKIPEQFLKFVDGPKFNRNQEHHRNQDLVLQRNDFTGSTGAEPPKIVRTNNFRNSVVDYRNHNRIQNVPVSYYPSPFYNQKPKPYTLMLPPPIKPIDGGRLTYTPQNDNVIFSEQSQFSTQTEEGPVQNERQTYNGPPIPSFPQPRPQQLHPQSYSPVHVQSRPQPQPHAQSTRPPSSYSSPPPLNANNQALLAEAGHSGFTQPVQMTRPKFDTSTPSVSFEKSNLVYHSTQTISGGWLASDSPSPELNPATWRTPYRPKEQFEPGDHHGAASSNHEVIIGQNANIIVDGENSENEEVVIGKKEPSGQEDVAAPTAATVTSEEVPSTTPQDIATAHPASDTRMHLVVANTGPVDAGSSMAKTAESVTVVMPTNYMNKLNVTVGDARRESEENVPKDIADTITSQIEQTIQISNPISPANVVTDPPLVSRPENRPDQMFQTNGIPLMNLTNRPHFANTASPVYHPMHQMIHPNHPTNHVSQMHQPNHAQQASQMNHIPPRSAFPPLSPQPLIQPRPNPPQPMMPFTHAGAGNRNPPAGMPPLAFHPQPGHVTRNQMPGPNVIDHRPSFSTMPQQFLHGPTPLPPETVRDPAHASLHTRPPGPPADVHAPTDETATSSLDLVTNYVKNQSPLAHILNAETNRPKDEPSSSPSTTTVPNLMTTDPIFSHYKQPAKPIRGPMYLIIQGHSKVKTYKPSVNKHGVPVENNEIREATTERPSKLEQLINENTKSREVPKAVQKRIKEEDEPRGKRWEQKDLLSLVESNQSGFTVPMPSPEEERRRRPTTTTIEINN